MQFTAGRFVFTKYAHTDSCLQQHDCLKQKWGERKGKCPFHPILSKSDLWDQSLSKGKRSHHNLPTDTWDIRGWQTVFVVSVCFCRRVWVCLQGFMKGQPYSHTHWCTCVYVFGMRVCVFRTWVQRKSNIMSLCLLVLLCLTLSLSLSLYLSLSLSLWLSRMSRETEGCPPFHYEMISLRYDRFCKQWDCVNRVLSELIKLSKYGTARQETLISLFDLPFTKIEEWLTAFFFWSF